MKAKIIVGCLALSLTAGLAQAQKSPPYNPKTGVYTIDNSSLPQAKKGEQSAGSQGTNSRPAQPAPQVTYPPDYWEKQEQLQRKEVAEYEKWYREQKQAVVLRAAEERAEKRWEEWQEAEKQSNRSGSSRTRHSSDSRGAVNAVTGEFYAPAGGGNLVGTRDGTLFTPAGPSGYINSRTGQFVPAH